MYCIEILNLLSADFLFAVTNMTDIIIVIQNIKEYKFLKKKKQFAKKKKMNLFPRNKHFVAEEFYWFSRTY